ncbi:MAG TPA: glycoside hydrolase family 130 protein [Phycisphaerae bacterium]|nr:glycoside hydrolase family 130 protein [Phycisphaerae bacterium]HPS52341.1 glycoside hydrolase family 130 protein [Phycisphaerae bacterium]
MTQPSKNIPNIPWEEKPSDCIDAIWRYRANPVIPRDLIPSSNSIFNSAVVPFEGAFAGVFRCDNKARQMRLHAGFSKDALNWQINPEPIIFNTQGKELPPFQCGYDPRVCWIEDRYWVTWCNGFAAQPTIGVAWTHDFKTFYQEENAFLPHNRNGVMFPRKINGRFAMLSRPSDNGHTPFGDIFYSESPDMTFWGHHRFVMAAGDSPWQSLKIGAGPIPIETSEGWLLIYHGVLRSCNGYVYSFGACLLDLEKPWQVIARNKNYLLSPQKLYECVGDVPNVAFPCAALHDAATGRIAIYYGGADTVTCMAFSTLDTLMAFVKDPNNQCVNAAM